MEKNLLRALLARRPAIRQEWERLLRLEKPASALAHPDTLARMIDWTLDEALAVLGRQWRRASRTALRRPRGYDNLSRACACGRNPLIEYFIAGERALLEALVLAQAETPEFARGSRATTATEVHLTVRRIARREVGLFCSICQHQGATEAPPAHSERASGSVSSNTSRIRALSSAGR
ncbi:MAG: hypothetical protein JNK23_09080 [Opitutaceae bacterium]|nr:hypothetical protein [Opitutaceae bacterium]